MAKKEKEVVKEKVFAVQARIIVDVMIEILAPDLTSAMEEAKGMNKDQFIDVQGEDLESDMRITGIFESFPGDAKL